MPRGDRSGPMGMGSRTGRGLGYCSGANAPGFANAAPGYGGMGWRRGGGMGAGMGRGMRGGGFGRGGGRGRGFWGAAPVYQPAPVAPIQSGAQEQQYLQQQADALQSELEAIKQRLAELETPGSGV